MKTKKEAKLANKNLKTLTLHGVDAEVIKELKLKAIREDRTLRDVAVDVLRDGIKKGGK